MLKYSHMESKDINIDLKPGEPYLNSLPIMLEGIQQFYPEGDSVEKPSTHACHELTYVRSGKIDYLIYGKRYRLEPGSTIVVRPNVPHSYVVIEECDITCIYLAYDMVRVKEHKELIVDPYYDFLRYKDQGGAGDKALAYGDMDLDMPDKEKFEHDPFRYAMMIRGRGRREIAHIIEEILKEDNAKEYGSVLMLQALTLQLLVHFSRAMTEEYEEQEQFRTGSAEKLVQIAKRYMDNNYDQEISIAGLADYVYLSQSYFTKAFREAFSDSPLNYLAKVRIDKACALLEETDDKVSNIANMVGFSSSQSFNAAFKRYMEQTPLQYRKQVRRAQN